MNSELITSIFLYVILYTSLVCAVLPLMFFLLWSFISFFKKHIWGFYILTAGLFVGATVLFYLTQKFWILWYYPFPAWAQVVGLFIWLLGIVMIKISEMGIGRMVRMFYPLLKGEKYHLKTTGIYSFVRHPIYTAFPLIIFGALLYTGQLILLVPLIFNLLTRTWYASKEEAYTQQVVIGDYESYKKKTPNRFYPKFF